MIVRVNDSNVAEAARIHSVSWRDSHRTFCDPAFIERHTPKRQMDYLLSKMARGTAVYMLVEGEPVGIVSVTGNLIEDLYVLPEYRNMGCGSRLLQFAIKRCDKTPTLWILENNVNAARLYRRSGFTATGKRHSITNALDEIEYSMMNEG